MSRSSLNQCKNRNSSDLGECITCGKEARWSAVFANLALALFKGIIGYISGSKAMLGDALFSFKDFISALVVILGTKISDKPADEQHPYGHGKVEYVVLFLISVGLIVATIFLFISSVKGVLYSGNDFAPKLIAFWAALISVVANFKLGQFLICVGEKLQSPSIVANARRNYSGAVSSIMVAIAVLGAHFFDFQFLDPLVALIEAVCLIGMIIEMIKESLKGLFDSALPSKTLEQIESIARIVPGVRKVSKVVARHLGQVISVDMTIKIDHTLTHQEAYLIVQHVKESIQAAIGDQTTVNIVFEPYMP